MPAQIPIKNGVAHTDHLVAVAASGSRVTGILDGQWTKELYNPSGTEVSGTVTVTVTELGTSGIYRITFTPNALGHWHLSLSNAANDQDHGGDYDSMAGILDDVYADTDAIDTRLPSDPADESLQQASHSVTQGAIAALNDLAQSDILSDATPFAGANIDAAISSRSDFDETADPVELLDSGGTAGTSAAELVTDIDTALSAAHGAGAWDATDSDWTTGEREQIRYRLALDGTQTDPTTGTGTLEDILADTDAIDSRLPSDPADESLQQASHVTTQAAIAALNDPTAAAIADQVWEEALADHSGTVGSTAEALAEIQTDVDAIDVRLPNDPADESLQQASHAATQAAIAALNDPTAAAIADAVWIETLADHSGVAGSTAEALAACSAGMTGAYQIDVTVEDGAAVPVQGALIDIYDATNTNFLAQFYTDINGEVSLALDAGTYNLRVWATGYSFTVPEVLVVTADASVTIVGVAGVVITPPSQPDLCVVYGYVYDAGGQPVGGACVSAVPTLPQVVDDKQQAERAIHTTTREDGYFEIELVRTAEVRIQIEFTDYNEIKTVPDTASQEFTSWS